MGTGHKIRVGLVYGGRSGEHEVSLQTALAVLKAFDYDKYELIPYYITKEGRWRSGSLLAAPPTAVAELQFDPQGTAEPGEATSSSLLPLMQGLSERAASEIAVPGGIATVDVVFPLLHGTFGEDGTIQGLLEMANLPYVGAGVLASSVGMDKAAMKTMFAAAGLPQVAYKSFTRFQWNKDREGLLDAIERDIGYPSFVKPANLGSSVGVSKARSREELASAIEEALRYDRKAIVEEFVDAREIEVAVLGNDEPRASVAGEIVSSNEFYDYKAKYIDGKSAMIIPAEIPEETSRAVREMAVRAFLAIDGAGLCRADFFLRKSDGALLVNEVNTMPGFTPFSMYPLLWQETGVSYRELLDTLIDLALARHAEKQLIDYGG
ncbi:D-alanine--D-alanine ligase [Cohnella sp. JJ-181]|uniref:D-alanine--D-alanine ligase n=1 Tax=Cohnella rhizoplanae TaxID=2974897 RepID=UPI0022FF6592|nr:D-alanine--D-alanine ligase [Cohnella sp. JJ-181]CAI6080228.1 D-alanine--D-alanine ligase [Cohnella sp. JJ-181]